MSVADNDARTKDGEASKTDGAYGVFLHAHYPRIANPAPDRASRSRKQAKLGDPGVVAATRKGADNADLKPFQFFLAPSRRSSADSHTAHGADGALAQNVAGKRNRALGKVSSAGIENDVAHPRSRCNGLSCHHHNFP